MKVMVNKEDLEEMIKDNNKELDENENNPDFDNWEYLDAIDWEEQLLEELKEKGLKEIEL